MNPARPLRILHVVGSLDRSWGGLSLYVAELAGELSAQGHRVEVVCEQAEANNPWPSGQAIVSGSSPGSGKWDAACEAADLIHVHGLWLPLYHRALAAARRRHKPHLLSVHGMLEPAALAFSRWKKRLAWVLYQRRDLRLTPALHATSRWESQSFRKLGLHQPVVTLPVGVRVPVLVNHECPPRRVAPHALFLGRIHPVKGILSLIDAWAAVRPKGWRLDLAGPDEAGHLAEVQQRLRDLKLDQDVTYHGPVFGSVKEHLLRQTSLLIAPSLTENFGIVVAEGLAHGLPVITTRGTPWEALERERCGWWVPLGRESLVKALREAVALPPDTLAEMGDRGVTLAKRDFSWPGIAARMAESYRWIMGLGGRPECVMID